jgi:integrase
VALRWKQLSQDLTAAGFYGLVVTVKRQGKSVRLPLPDRARTALDDYAAVKWDVTDPLEGAVFTNSSCPPQQLSYRSTRAIVARACVDAGVPPAESAALRAGFAHWLRTQGLSDHEVASVLGIARVRTVDRLLARHAALDAQRCLREVLNR